MPTISSTVKGTLNQVNAGKANQIQFPTPGAKKVTALANVTGLNKGLSSGFKEGVRVAQHAKPLPGISRAARREHIRQGPAVFHTLGRKTGAAAHDFRAGYNRHIHAAADVDAGRVTSRRNAVYPAAYQTGHLSRRYGLPAVTLGGAYVVGRKIGHRNKVKKMAEENYVGGLKPAPKRIVKSYGYDPEHNRHRRAGVATGLAAAGSVTAGSAAAYHGVQAAKKGNFKLNPSKTGKFNSVTVRRAGVEHGAKALGLTAVAGTAAYAAKKIRNKQTKGDWQSYY
jgi:hypothetical protein